VLGATGNDYRAAVGAALGAATVGVVAALAIAVLERRREAHRIREELADEQPAEAHP
jgi:hypothetical protein